LSTLPQFSTPGRLDRRSPVSSSSSGTGPVGGTQEAALRLLAIPATRARTAQPVVLHLSGRSPWAGLTLTGLT